MTATSAPVIAGIVLMVPEADHLTPAAHITLLAPFGADAQATPEELDEVERFFADVPAFGFELAGESRFPDGTRYLCPEPASAFSRLTHRLHRLFPEYPPYAGRFDLVVPHLTIPDDIAVPTGPLRVHAREASLLRYDGEFAVQRTFPLGTSAA